MKKGGRAAHARGDGNLWKSDFNPEGWIVNASLMRHQIGNGGPS